MSNELTVLIVDDDPVIRTLLERYLSQHYKVYVAGNGEIALEILQQLNTKIDVVLSDIEMTELDGLGLLGEIRKAYPDICVIMISGSADTSTAVEALRKGAYDYISKPFSDMEEIDIIIQRWQQQQSLEVKLAQYASLHKEMMKNMKTRSFLAVDVVGSTKIKQGEDPFIVQYSFTAYHEFITSIVEKHNGEVHSTSGDGAMACFDEAVNAIEAASNIIAELDSFNANQSQLEEDFVLRIGIHCGQVIIKEDGQINEMFSESLDIAGHIQKDGDSNCVTVSKDLLDALGDTSSFISMDKSVDGIELFKLDAGKNAGSRQPLPK